MADITIVPGEALAIQILKVVANGQEIFMQAPEKYRDEYFERLNKMEEFWFKLFEPLGKLILAGMNKEAEKLPGKP